MPKLPKIFEPTLHVPQGLNNYSGDVFRCFTKGDTLPFRFRFNAKDAALDVTGWSVSVTISDTPSSGLGCDDTSVSVETEIPLVDLENGIFEGAMADLQTQGLPAGICYGIAKYKTAPTVDEAGDPVAGETFIIDMCILEVYPNPTFIDL